jgi:hypothetical protein
MAGACPQGGREETFLKSFLRESGHSGMIVEMVKQIHFLNSVALGADLYVCPKPCRNSPSQLQNAGISIFIILIGINNG